jgi:hypothetical protein
VAEPRFPHVPPAAGHYESFYLRAADPARPRCAWIRCTTHQRPGEPPTGSVWCTWFDPPAPPYAVKRTHPRPVVPPEGWIAIGDSRLGPRAARGSAEGEGRRAAWDLTIEPAAESLQHLPAAWMYRARLPRTKLESPAPDAYFNGRFEAGGAVAELHGWRGMTGHNWGAEHAAAWIWLHAGFGEGEWLDLSIGRVRAGPVLTPWIANGAFCTRGETSRLGGARPARVRAEPGHARVALRDVEIEVRSPPGQTVAWRYADPRGGEHHSLNCSIAELTLRVRGHELHTAHGAAYELGTRETSHGIGVEPFPDG